MAPTFALWPTSFRRQPEAMQVPSHKVQATPPDPQAEPLVPAWHTPIESQQPGHVVAQGPASTPPSVPPSGPQPAPPSQGWQDGPQPITVDGQQLFGLPLRADGFETHVVPGSKHTRPS